MAKINGHAVVENDYGYHFFFTYKLFIINTRNLEQNRREEKKELIDQSKTAV